MRNLLLVGTPKGAFILDSDEARRDWSLRGPLCDGWPIHDLIVEPRTGDLLAAGGSPWYGPAVWRSSDLGTTWTHSSSGLTYGDGDGVEPIKTVWSLATTPDGAILAGVEPAGLFRSDDDGATWRHVAGLTEHPTRSSWEPGAGGLILHTIVPHPTDPARTWVGISAVGVFETRDGGATWEPRNRGVRADFFPDPHPVTGQCVHKFAAAAGEPETLYQQNHCGVYRSLDGGVDVDGPDDRACRASSGSRSWPIRAIPRRSGSSRSTATTAAASCRTRAAPCGGPTTAATRGSVPATGCPSRTPT